MKPACRSLRSRPRDGEDHDDVAVVESNGDLILVYWSLVDNNEIDIGSCDPTVAAAYLLNLEAAEA